MIKLSYNIADIGDMLETLEENTIEYGDASEGMLIDIEETSHKELLNRINIELIEELQIFVTVDQINKGYLVSFVRLVDSAGEIENVLTQEEINQIASELYDLIKLATTAII